MKIRIKDNSIRFRLTKSEVKQLSETGICEATSTAGTQSFRYSVVVDNDVNILAAEIEPYAISLVMNKKLAQDWNAKRTVGHYADQPNADGSTLRLTIEKDFVCMDESVEDQSDNYPNPKMNT